MNPSKLSALTLALLAVHAAADSPADTVHNQDGELQTVHVSGKKKLQNAYTVSEMSTATGLKLAPKDTPQSVSVITRKQMDDLGATTLEDALKNTTGLNIYRQSYQFRYQSRGFDIAQISEDGVNSTVCTMCGNNPHDQKQLTDTSIYERIEVVRGATGLFKSQGDPGGSINAVKKRPTGEPLTELTASANRFGTVRGGADVSGTLSEAAQIRGRAVVSAERSREFRDTVDGNKTVLYGVADKRFGDNAKITVGAVYHHEYDTPPLFGLPINPDGSDPHLPRSTYLGADWNRARYNKLNFFAEWEQNFSDDWKMTAMADWLKSKSVTEYAYVPQRSNIRADGTVTDGFRGRSDRVTRQWSFKIDVDGKYRLFGHKHDFYARYNYNREQFDNLWRGRKLENLNLSVFDFHHGQIAKPDNWDDLGREERLTKPVTHTATLFTRLNFGRLHLLAGTSYNYWKQHQYISFFSKPYSNDHKGYFTPYAGITYDLNKQNSLYASYSDIAKWNGEYYDIDKKLLPPVRGHSYEIGWKGAWNQGRLNTAVVFFHTERHNQPIDTWLGFDPQTGAVRPWQRGDQAIYTPVRMESRGLDLEIAGNITPDWHLFAGYTYNKRRYTRTAAARTAERNGRGVDFSQHTPQHIFRANTSYRLPGAANKWRITGGFRMQSKSSPITVNNRKQYLSGYTVWDAGVQYEPNRHIKVGLNINNLTNKRYYESYANRGTNQGHFYGEPRNVTLNFKWTM